MNNRDAQIAAVLALDLKRTPGEWSASSGYSGVYKRIDRRDCELICHCDPNDECGPQHHHDAAFIAAAPLMATIIRQLAAERAADAADARRWNAVRHHLSPRLITNILAHYTRDADGDPDNFLLQPEVMRPQDGWSIEDWMDAIVDTAITSAGGTTDE